LRAQETSFEATGTRVDQGGHAAGQPEEHLAGRIHCWCCASYTHWHLSVSLPRWALRVWSLTRIPFC
jgi:hypothetical protein